MPLGTANTSTALVRNKLGESTNDVGTLCTSPKINMWSRRKPFRDSRTVIPVNQVGQDADGNWGLTIPSYDNTDTKLWEYNKPIDSIWPKRLGDFRGYYHNAKIPMIVQPRPKSVYENFSVYTIIGQSTVHSIGLDDFFEDKLNLGVEVFNQEGNSLGWGSSETIVEINVSRYVPAVTKISAKFFLTDEKKDFGLHTVQHARWALPRERLNQNKFWVDVNVVNNPPTSDYFTIVVGNLTQTPHEYTVRIGNIPLNVSSVRMVFKPTAGVGTEITSLTVSVTPGDFQTIRELPVTPGTMYDVELYFPPDQVIKRQTVLIAPDVIAET